MAVRSKSMVPSTASRVVIRVERYAFGRMSGLVHNPYLDTIQTFADVMDLADKLDAMFDSLEFPQAAVTYRSFTVKNGGKKTTTAEAAANAHAGAGEEPVLGQSGEDVFFVHVQFRQNASWQGTIRWKAQAGEVRFRSMLELLKIMDGVLAERYPDQVGETGEK